jgi:hypothetical protein
MELDFQPYSSGNGNDNVSSWIHFTPFIFFFQVLACRYFNCFNFQSWFQIVVRFRLFYYYKHLNFGKIRPML